MSCILEDFIEKALLKLASASLDTMVAKFQVSTITYTTIMMLLADSRIFQITFT